MKLYTYYRSSAAFRVRIALNLKGLDYESIPVHLVRNQGEHKTADYLSKNPQGLLPLLEVNAAGPSNIAEDDSIDSSFIPQSLAIIEYLDEVHPQPALLPSEPISRAQARALAFNIACDIHPLNNLRVLRHLQQTLGLSDEQKNNWYKHWVNIGFSSIEASLAALHKGQDLPFSVGHTASIVDCCLIPQVYNAQRFECDLSAFPHINRINANCLQMAEFVEALPENQPDAE